MPELFRHSGIKPGMAGLLFLFYLFLSASYANDIFQSGHIKYQSLLVDNQSPEHNIDTRLNLSLRQSNWALQSDYQLLRSKNIVNDDNRLFDLTADIHEGRQYTIAHRLDRFHLTYTSEQAVFRLGRQAISWGNGLVYNPMDFFNPFDPAAIDTEYKTGDDMLYSQLSFESGDDLQIAWVGRRDDEGDSNSDVSSLAAKYHIFLEDSEFDFLLAEHFDSAIIGLGGVFNVGGSVWRSDFISTEVDNEWINSAVINASYSWMTLGKNTSGHIEYYRNGFGIDDGDYSPTRLAQNPQLLSRILRGELFSLGKNNLSASMTVELTPLWLLTTTLFADLDDDSQLLQFVSRHDLQQDLALLVAMNFPSDENSELGVIEESLFIQLAYYF